MRKIYFFVGITLVAAGLLFFILAITGASNKSGLLNFEPPEVYQQENDLSVSDRATSSKRIIIPKIGVDMPIITDEINERKALKAGAWLLPGTAAPDSTSTYNNTVISAHRFLRTSGPNTFFRLDQLAAGDEVLISWNGQKYKYIVSEKSIVKPSAVYILDKTPFKVLTLFTCHPVYSTKERLVVRAKLEEKN